jgi:hypothetical protein
MPYFIDTQSSSVVVLPPGARVDLARTLIAQEVAEACGLTHGQPLDADQQAALREGSVDRFMSSLGETSLQERAVAAALEHRSHSTTSATAAPARTPQVIASASRRATSAARVVELASWIFLVVSLILGAVVTADTSIDQNGETIHPHVALGISVAVVGVFEALVVIMFAAYIQARLQHPSSD